MTQEELDKLPFDNGPLYQGEDDIIQVRDSQGRYWMIGWANGVLCKNLISM